MGLGRRAMEHVQGQMAHVAPRARSSGRSGLLSVGRSEPRSDPATMRAGHVVPHRCLVQPGPLFGRPAARWACAREAQRARSHGVARVVLASLPSRPSGEPLRRPQRPEPRCAAGTALRAAASDSSSTFPAVDGGVCVGLTS